MKKDREDEEEHETIKATNNLKPVGNEEESQILDDHEMTKPQFPGEVPNEVISRKRKPT